MPAIRILVVDDSLTVRKRIVEVLGAHPEFEVVAEAEDGKQAVELCERLRPNVITLDMMLPVMSGLAATEYIMAYSPTPIVIVSASVNRGELYHTYDALAAGALDVVEKPSEHEDPLEWERKLSDAVRIASRVKVITHPRGRMRQAPAALAQPLNPSTRCRLVAIGASTGGPGAVVQILKSLPPTFALPILLVVHLNKTFAGSFAEWLDSQSAFRVRFATDGEQLPALGTGCVLLAPPDRHMVVDGNRLRLSSEPERHSCRPSVDVLFESVAAYHGRQCTACLLTGMGRDGADGLLALRRAGAATIAQDEASSIVFGMPQQAIQLGAAERVLSLNQIAPALAALDTQNERGT
jgi:two-component system, chemotaxis family, protein-glutamate methylesterase/glutaminase